MNKVTLLEQFSYLQPDGQGGLESSLLDVVCIDVSDFITLETPIIALSDMQGLVQQSDSLIPLGIEVFETILPILALDGVTPPIEESMCLIAGDMYACTSDYRRGLSGNIDNVIESALNANLRQLAVVMGNHDTLSESVKNKMLVKPGVALLDGHVMQSANLVVGGISGIMGNPAKKPYRNDEKMFMSKLNKLVKASADIIVLHEGPHLDHHQIGHRFIRGQLLALHNKIVISGHAHWQNPIAKLGSNLIINTDARIVILR